MAGSYEVEAFVKSDLSDEVLDFNVDVPSSAIRQEGHLLSISGWAAPRGVPITAISIREEWQVITKASLGQIREDIPGTIWWRAVEPDCGFTAVVSLIGVRSEFTLDVVVHFSNGHKEKLGHINGRRVPLNPAPVADEIAPLMVTSLGRTGTTWLMHILSKHPDAAVYPQWPYELSGTRFWLRALRTVVERPHGLDQPKLIETADPGNWWNGFNPYYSDEMQRWLAAEYVEMTADWARRATRSFFKAMAGSQGRPAAMYFAEKALPDIAAREVMEVFPETKEIILVRDFRAMVASINAMNKRRGTNDFSRNLVKTDEDFVKLLAVSVTSLLRASHERPEALVARYEDLIRQPEQTIAGILEHLGLPADGTEIRAILDSASERVPEMSDHQTAASAEDSLTRWRTELAPEIVSACNTHFSKALSAFGYEES